MEVGRSPCAQRRKYKGLGGEGSGVGRGMERKEREGAAEYAGEGKGCQVQGNGMILT